MKWLTTLTKRGVSPQGDREILRQSYDKVVHEPKAGECLIMSQTGG